MEAKKNRVIGGSLLERINRKIEISENGCWVWQGSVWGRGYATMSWKGRSDYLHRIVLRELRGQPTPPGFMVDHLCRVIRCVNPDHLELVTPSVNVQRGHLARGTAKGKYSQQV